MSRLIADATRLRAIRTQVQRIAKEQADPVASRNYGAQDQLSEVELEEDGPEAIRVDVKAVGPLDRLVRRVRVARVREEAVRERPQRGRDDEAGEEEVEPDHAQHETEDLYWRVVRV